MTACRLLFFFVVAAFACACPLLPGPENLVATTNLEVIVTGAAPSARVDVTVDAQTGSGAAKDDGSVDFHFAVHAGPHHGAVTVFNADNPPSPVHCGAFDVDVAAGDGATVSIDARIVAGCPTAEGEGEGEGEGSACSVDADCGDDGASCTAHERCLRGVCVGSYDATACGACDVDCASTCGACCVENHGTCQDECGICLGNCTDTTCVCDNSTCARLAAGGSVTSLFCENAACNDVIHAVTDASVACEHQAACDVEVLGENNGALGTCTDQSECRWTSSATGRTSVSCTDASCDLDCTAAGGFCEVECNDNATCALSADTGRSAQIVCSPHAASCSLTCNGVEQRCAPGATCSCP